MVKERDRDRERKKITQNCVFFLICIFRAAFDGLQRTEPGPESKRIMTLLSKMEMSQAHRDVGVDLTKDSQYI